MERAGPELPMEQLSGRGSGSESAPPSPGPAGGDGGQPELPRSLGLGSDGSPGSAESPTPAAEEPRDGESPGPEPGTRAPMELQVDVRVTPVGAASGRTPSPAPATRFLTVPVPESPACARRAAPPLPSPGATRNPLATLWAEENAGPVPGSPPGCCRCRCRCRCREPGLERQEGAALLPDAGETRLPRAIKLIGLPTYMRSLRWALVIMAFLLAVCTITMVALASRAGARCRRCPQGWMWAEGQCFYLSTDTGTWKASQAFCSAHHATLPLLSHTQGFLSKYHVVPRSWVGALRGPRGWYWTDGTPLPLQLIPEEEEQHENPSELSCGGLEEGRLAALDCTAPRPWVCACEPQ